MLFFYRSDDQPADRSLKRQAGALVRVEDLQVELNMVEVALDQIDSNLIPDFKKTYSEQGGEQFRPNESLVKCRCTSLRTCHS